jgi:hypothetical protein
MCQSDAVRTPPSHIRRQLRVEVGFGCPVSGCDNPYLEYHHFDPPWRNGKRHDPDGMIALCGEHHKKADGGAFTVDQLRELKARSPRPVAGRFDWMRRDLLAVMGGNLYYQTATLVELNEQPLVWFDRDEFGHLLLNVGLPSEERSLPQMVLENNDWTVDGRVKDVESPASGKYLRITFTNEDRVEVRYRELSAATDAMRQYPLFSKSVWSELPSFPLTAVELTIRIPALGISFGPDRTTLPGGTMAGILFQQNVVALAF